MVKLFLKPIWPKRNAPRKCDKSVTMKITPSRQAYIENEYAWKPLPQSIKKEETVV